MLATLVTLMDKLAAVLAVKHQVLKLSICHSKTLAICWHGNFWISWEWWRLTLWWKEWVKTFHASYGLASSAICSSKKPQRVSQITSYRNSGRAFPCRRCKVRHALLCQSTRQRLKMKKQCPDLLVNPSKLTESKKRKRIKVHLLLKASINNFWSFKEQSI